jgi:predicted aspartyl protease
VNVRIPGGDRYFTTRMLDNTGSTIFMLDYNEAYAIGYNPNTLPTFRTVVATANGFVVRDRKFRL